MWSGDVKVSELAILVTIRWSKTIEKEERLLQASLTPIKCSPLCRVNAYLCYVKAIPRIKPFPLFLLKSGKVILFIKGFFYSAYLQKPRLVIKN